MTTKKKFDYTKAKQSAKKLMECKKLQLVVLGSQGAGKSFVVGTLGEKTLYLYGTREGHGPIAASTLGGDNIVPMCIDYGFVGDEKTERAFTADESFALLEQILKDHDYIKSEGFKAIAVDGLPVLEAIVKETTTWKERCRTASNKHNTYREVESSQEVLGIIFGWMKAAQIDLDIHLIVTGIIDVKDSDQYGAVVEAAPRMAGYGLAECVNQHFGDIVVTGKMTKDGETKYKLQFLTELTKVSKDLTGTQKKAMNFNPRLTGVKNPPSIMNADLAELAQRKAGTWVEPA